MRIEIQTAGNSATPGPEEKMDGIPMNQLEEIRNYIQSRVRTITGSPGTSLDADLNTPDGILRAILGEVKSLNEKLESNK